MDRRRFIQMLGLSVPLMASGTSYFFAPKGGWTQAKSGIYLHNGIILCPEDYRRLVEGIRPNVWTPTRPGNHYETVAEVRY